MKHPHADQFGTLDGPFFETDLVKAAPALRHSGRVFIGKGWQHNQRPDGGVSGGSWMQSFPSAGAVSPVVEWDYAEDMGRLVVVSDFGLAISGASRTFGGADAQAVNGFAINDVAGTRKAWGAYFDAVRTVAGAGNVQGVEVNVSNLPGVSPRGGATPYNAFTNGMSVGLGIAAGSGVTSFGNSYAVDAMAEFRHNGAAAWTGINFRSNALMREGMADDRTEPGNTGYARAISLANEQGFSWYSRDPVGAPGSGTQAEVARLFSSITNPAVRQTLQFTDAGLYFNSRAAGGGDPDADPMFVMDYSAGADSYMASFPSGPALAPGFAARGDAADIDLMLVPKGAGLLRLNTTIGAASVPSAFSAVNFLRIKGAGGSIYYIPLATGAW